MKKIWHLSSCPRKEFRDAWKRFRRKVLSFFFSTNGISLFRNLPQLLRLQLRLQRLGVLLLLVRRQRQRRRRRRGGVTVSVELNSWTRKKLKPEKIMMMVLEFQEQKVFYALEKKSAVGWSQNQRFYFPRAPLWCFFIENCFAFDSLRKAECSSTLCDGIRAVLMV